MSLPDYVLDANAVMKDEAKWRHGKAPDYTKTRQVWENCKCYSRLFGRHMAKQVC